MNNVANNLPLVSDTSWPIVYFYIQSVGKELSLPTVI